MSHRFIPDQLTPPLVLCLVLLLIGLNFHVDSQALAAFLGRANQIATVTIPRIVTVPLTVGGIVALAMNAGKMFLSYHLATRCFTGRWHLKTAVRVIYVLIILGSLTLTQLFFAEQLLDSRLEAHIRAEHARIEAQVIREDRALKARFREQMQQELHQSEAPVARQIALLDRTIAEAKQGMGTEVATNPGPKYGAHKILFDEATRQRNALLQGQGAQKAAIITRINDSQARALAALQARHAAARAALTPEALQGQPMVQNRSMLNLAQLLTTLAPDRGQGGLIVAPATLAVIATVFLSLMIEMMIIALLSVVFLPRRVAARPDRAARSEVGRGVAPLPVGDKTPWRAQRDTPPGIAAE